MHSFLGKAAEGGQRPSSFLDTV